MAMLKSLFYLLLMLVFIVAGLIFSFRNHTQVSVDLLFFQSSDFSIGFWLLVSFVVGAVLGIILIVPNNLVNKLKVHQLSKKVTKNKLSQSLIQVESNKGS